MSDEKPKQAEDNGPFYVEAGCCMRCGIPESIAPELFVLADDGCYLKRQPHSQEEIDKAIVAMWSSEVDCIRYRGDDPAILKRLGEAGMADYSDNSDAYAHEPVERHRVMFKISSEAPEFSDASALADTFRIYLRRHDRMKVRANLVGSPAVTFSWYVDFHTVTFDDMNGPRAMMATLTPSGNALKGLARLVDDWLRSDCGASDVTWRSEYEFRLRLPGIPKPY